MDHDALLKAKGPRHLTKDRALDVRKAVAQLGARARAHAEALGPAAIGRRHERIERLKAARRRG